MNPSTQDFLQAARQGDLWTMAITHWLGADINGVTYPEGQTALILAVRNQDLVAVRWLLMEGADVNKADSEGMTALHHAATGSSLLWDLLIDAGASDRIENKKGLAARDLRLGQKRTRRMTHGL